MMQVDRSSKIALFVGPSNSKGKEEKRTGFPMSSEKYLYPRIFQRIFPHLRWSVEASLNPQYSLTLSIR